MLWGEAHTHLISPPLSDGPFTHTTYSHPSTLEVQWKGLLCDKCLDGTMGLCCLCSATVLSSDPTVSIPNCHACSSIINLHVSPIMGFLGAEINQTHFYSPSTPVKELRLFFHSHFSFSMCLSVLMCVGIGVGVYMYVEV